MGVDTLGPGHYDNADNALDALKERISGGAIAFNKGVGRSEAIGPYGQRPQNALEVERDLLGGLEGDILDLSPTYKPKKGKILHTFAQVE